MSNIPLFLNSFAKIPWFFSRCCRTWKPNTKHRSSWGKEIFISEFLYPKTFKDYLFLNTHENYDRSAQKNWHLNSCPIMTASLDESKLVALKPTKKKRKNRMLHLTNSSLNYQSWDRAAGCINMEQGWITAWMEQILPPSCVLRIQRN